MSGDYDAVNGAWGRSPLPAITRDEASKAARRLMRRFARRKSSWMRRCWISLKPTQSLDRGWARLAHDISHRAYRYVYRAAAPKGGHSRTHAALELSIVQYIVTSGWLDGTLKPKLKPRLSIDVRRAQRLNAATIALANWERKLKLANTKVKKYRLRIHTLERAAILAALSSQEVP